MKSSVFITGVSRGLGKGLAQVCLADGHEVYSCSRSGASFDKNMHHVDCDLSALDDIEQTLSQLLAEVRSLELVILNAGMIGQVKKMQDTDVTELEKIMSVNVWSNKKILDFLLKSNISIKQIVLISSGAAVLGSKGMSGYAISKAALNMLSKLYAHEFPDTHICAIAPGLISTDMMDYLCHDTDAEAYPAIQRLKSSIGTEAMQTPEEAAGKIIKALSTLTEFASGEFVDLREI